MRLTSLTFTRARKLALGSVSTLALLAMLPTSANAAPSTFQNSCRNIELQVDPSMVRMQADCRTRDGGYTQSGIRVVGISNEFGSLRRLNNAPSSFQNSCDDIELHTNSNEVKITAICEDGRGGTKRTSFVINGVDNIDGKLMPHKN